MISNLLNGLDGLTLRSIILMCSPVLLGILYVYNCIRYWRAHQSKHFGQLPPKYPTFIPYLGLGLPLLWDLRGAVKRFATYNGNSTTARLSVLPGVDVYLFQDATIIPQLWKDSSLFDSLKLHAFVLRNGFGLSKRAEKLFLADKSGHQAKPSAGCNIPQDARIHRMLYLNDQRAMAGSGLGTTFNRFQEGLQRRTIEITTGDWTELPDFWTFMQDTVAASLIESILGPSLLQVSPKFIRSLFAFDHVAPALLKGLPFTGAKGVRREVLSQFQPWYDYAKEKFTEESIYQDGDGDPFWGSTWTRYRHTVISRFFDDDALSSMDLGVAWGAVTNVIPCAMMAVIHVLRDSVTLSHLRRDLEEVCAGRPFSDVEASSITSHSMLCAIYAETLRLHVTLFIPVHPINGDLAFGKWRVPKGSYGLISSALCQTDENMWNTQDGLHPTDSFWARRFLVDPNDPLSGPVNPKRRPVYSKGKPVSGKPFFTTEGVEGSWIPYGGGPSICPGRFLSKNIMTYTCAFFIDQFDIEILTDSISFSKDRFGLGVEHPTNHIPFRIRRR